MKPVHNGSLRDALDGKIFAVTGAGGFLGGKLMTRLAGVRCRVVRTADLADQSVWDDVAGEADIVVHLAAQTSTAIAAENAAADFEANVMPMRRLLDACRRGPRPPLLVVAGTRGPAGPPAGRAAPTPVGGARPGGRARRFAYVTQLLPP